MPIYEYVCPKCGRPFELRLALGRAAFLEKTADLGQERGRAHLQVIAADRRERGQAVGVERVAADPVAANVVDPDGRRAGIRVGGVRPRVARDGSQVANANDRRLEVDVAARLQGEVAGQVGVGVDAGEHGDVVVRL